MTIINGARPKQAPPPVVDTSKSIEFTFDGQRHTAYAGDTIASALYRSGVRTFSRSFKYHRPRGLMCVGGACPNCLVGVDGAPSELACITAVKASMSVSSQNAWPSLQTDFMNVNDKLSDLLPAGFYYKTFIWPRAMWPVYETVLRNAAGVGKIDALPERHTERYYDKQYRQPADSTVD